MAFALIGGLLNTNRLMKTTAGVVRLKGGQLNVSVLPGNIHRNHLVVPVEQNGQYYAIYLSSSDLDEFIRTDQEFFDNPKDAVKDAIDRLEAELLLVDLDSAS